MKLLKYLGLGIFFGIILTKAQVVSWFRIFEMFRFDAFHMYGIIGSAVVLGAAFVALSKRKAWKSAEGNRFQLIDYPKGWKNYLIGGTIFGMGWAMTGACPGPLFILFGKGHLMILFAIGGALLGTLVYGIVRHKLPR
jgi:uncharacterized membrane protein YedE/YeeE